VDRAFRKLEQLRPYIMWWQDEVEAVRLLATGDVLMTSAPSSAVAEANRQEGRTFALQWQGGLTTVAALAIARGAPNPAEAMRLLVIAADPRVQAGLPALAPLGPLAKGALEGMPAAEVGLLPTGPVALGGAIAMDEAFWRDHQAKLSQRFDVWLPR
jgi:putative spermidine/putrescine transport system substrate-binding protein